MVSALGLESARVALYVNKLLVRVRLSFQNFCKLAKQAETIYKKPSNTGFLMIKHCLKNSHINSIPE